MAKILSPRNMLVLPRGNRKTAKFLLDPFHTLSRGLVAYYPLGDVVAGVTQDVSQYGKAATIVVPATAPVLASSHHGGLSFNTNGSTPYCSASKPIALTYPLSFSVWAKCTSLPGVGADQVIMSLANASGLEEFWIGLYNDVGGPYIRTIAQSNSGTNNRWLGVVFSSTTWHHYVGVFLDSSTQVIYVDGVLQSGSYHTIGTGTPTPSGIDTTFIGALVYNGLNLYGNFNGSIENARIYNRGLSSSEVGQLYAEPYAGTLQSPVNLVGGNTVVTAVGSIALDIAVVGVGVALRKSAGSVALDIAVSGTGAANTSAVGSVGVAMAMVGAGAAQATSAASVTLNVDIAGAGAARVTAIGDISLLIAVSGFGVAGRLGVGAISINISAAAVGRSVALSTGSIAMNIAILGYMVDANIRYLPIYTIMRNTTVPASGGMSDEIVACEGTFY